jgi:hypothetical protein
VNVSCRLALRSDWKPFRRADGILERSSSFRMSMRRRHGNKWLTVHDVPVYPSADDPRMTRCSNAHSHQHDEQHPEVDLPLDLHQPRFLLLRESLKSEIPSLEVLIGRNGLKADIVLLEFGCHGSSCVWACLEGHQRSEGDGPRFNPKKLRISIKGDPGGFRRCRYPRTVHEAGASDRSRNSNAPWLFKLVEAVSSPSGQGQ